MTIVRFSNILTFSYTVKVADCYLFGREINSYHSLIDTNKNNYHVMFFIDCDLVNLGLIGDYQ
jgi:hypothetical protein